ncbi:Uncharacterised protein [Nocardia brasiliensis]|nr:Uncharacterised protein [Nocardia brasiliensis]
MSPWSAERSAGYPVRAGSSTSAVRVIGVGGVAHRCGGCGHRSGRGSVPSGGGLRPGRSGGRCAGTAVRRRAVPTGMYGLPSLIGDRRIGSGRNRLREYMSEVR